MQEVARRLHPDTWAWIGDSVEVCGNLDECLETAARSPGFVLTQFSHPSDIDNRHPERLDDGRVSRGSAMFFHGEANERLLADIRPEDLDDDPDVVFGRLYQSSPAWREGFCDFSTRFWQRDCSSPDELAAACRGRLVRLHGCTPGSELHKAWEEYMSKLPHAPFETQPEAVSPFEQDDGPVDAVFVIGTGSVDNNEELRYALRNLERNCRFVRNVYICGFCPPWVDRSAVKHLNWPDRFRHAKDANIVDKLRHACEEPGIARRILFCSDDQFQTRECTWDDFAPMYLRRYRSDDRWYENRRRLWHTRLRKTMERDVQRRKAAGLDTENVFYWQPHIWMQIDRDRFISYARWSDYERRDDTIIASGYYNFIDAKGRVDPGGIHTFLTDSAPDKVPDALHVAYHDGSYKTAMKILRRMFPDRSRFELPDASVRRPDAKPSIQSAPARPPTERPAAKAPAAQEDSVRSVIPRQSGDPSPATRLETAEIQAIVRRILDTPVWHGLSGEIAKAEEMRLYGARGRRVVWNDIMRRWADCTSSGASVRPIDAPRSPAAERILAMYAENPGSMRTRHPGRHSERLVDTASIRSRVRSLLRGRVAK